MKEGDVGIAHGANWSGVFKISNLRVTEPRLLTKPDHWEYGEFDLSEDGRLKLPPIFVQRLEAESKDAALRQCEEIWKRRHPMTEMTPVASKEAERAREAVLAKTDFGKVLEAISAGDPMRAIKLFDDITAALSNAPHEDDKASVVRLRKLFEKRKAGRRSWHFLLVAHWDDLPKNHKEISLWLEQHGERGVSAATVARFMQRLNVKSEKTTN